MHAARFLTGMIGILVVFAVATFYLTGSFTAVLVQAALCALFMQIVYSAAVLCIVWKRGLGAVNHDLDSSSARCARLDGDSTFDFRRGSGDRPEQCNGTCPSQTPQYADLAPRLTASVRCGRDR
ncbi:hypothetical protein DPM35_26130 [Mesorhizobium atlanticum]|uniref:Exopolysaccharide production repressor exox n=1 Tax=Mesorhizobium atlanticum TaxID=2233532 RepID=A0A330GN11_9HYPH|nr:hypothetical protein DPM35_26130 [Mesorhizobium atlanticum]